MIIGHCGWGHVLIPNIKRVLCSCYPWISSDFISFRNTHMWSIVVTKCHPLFMFFVRRDLLFGHWAVLFLKSLHLLAYRKHIISGDKHRKQDVLPCCEAIFLPFSIKSLGCEQLCQLLDRTRKATGRKSSLILTLPPSSKNSSFNHFPYIYPISSAEYLWR